MKSGYTHYTPADAVAGFTLLEVLVALSIAAIALGTLLSVSTDSVYRSASLQQTIIAQWVAENKASEIRLNKDTLRLGEQKEQTTLLNYNWLVKTQIDKTPDPYVKQIVVKVYSPQQKQRPIAQLTSYVAK